MRNTALLLQVHSWFHGRATAHAQQGTSAIRGRISDAQGGVLPGVAIVVTHAESGTIRETVTGPDGTYLVPALVPGPYRITAALQGFRRLMQEDIVLRIGTTLQLDLTLQVGALEESLTVTAEAPQVDITSAQIGGNLSPAEMRELPSGSRNYAGGAAAWRGVQPFE